MATAAQCETTVPQRGLLSHRGDYCPTEGTTVPQRGLLSHKGDYCPSESLSLRVPTMFVLTSKMDEDLQLTKDEAADAAEADDAHTSRHVD